MEFDFRPGDIITPVSSAPATSTIARSGGGCHCCSGTASCRHSAAVDLPWSIRLESPGEERFHGVPHGCLALVLSVEKLEDSLYDKYKITMCADGVVGWSSERDYQWLRHWSVVARLEA